MPQFFAVAENRRRSRAEREFELQDTGVFRDHRFFDVQAEYAKAASIHPLNLAARLGVAEYHERKSDWDAAIAEYRKAEGDFPSHPMPSSAHRPRKGSRPVAWHPAHWVSQSGSRQYARFHSLAPRSQIGGRTTRASPFRLTKRCTWRLPST